MGGRLARRWTAFGREGVGPISKSPRGPSRQAQTLAVRRDGRGRTAAAAPSHVTLMSSPLARPVDPYLHPAPGAWNLMGLPGSLQVLSGARRLVQGARAAVPFHLAESA